jgi:phosphatidate cytidylyltransferase
MPENLAKLTFWGVRGSTPTVDRATWRYGGNTPCLELVVPDGTRFILDCGTGLRTLGNRLAAAAGVSAAGLLFVVLPLSAVVRLQGVPVIGPKLLLLTLVLVWAGDTLAYFIGRSFGRLLMAPQLSPKKTWEGSAANLLASLLVGFLFARWLPLDTWQVVVMAGLANIAGQAGDLLKSSYKRGAGVKDSGDLLPGHGGMLDRIDALILAAPVVWYYFQWVLASHA